MLEKKQQNVCVLTSESSFFFLFCNQSVRHVQAFMSGCMHVHVCGEAAYKQRWSLFTSSVSLWEAAIYQAIQTNIKSVYNEEEGVYVDVFVWHVCVCDYHPIIVYFSLFRFQVQLARKCNFLLKRLILQHPAVVFVWRERETER